MISFFIRFEKPKFALHTVALSPPTQKDYTRKKTTHAHDTFAKKMRRKDDNVAVPLRITGARLRAPAQPVRLDDAVDHQVAQHKARPYGAEHAW